MMNILVSLRDWIKTLTNCILCMPMHLKVFALAIGGDSRTAGAARAAP